NRTPNRLAKSLRRGDLAISQIYAWRSGCRDLQVLLQSAANIWSEGPISQKQWPIRPLSLFPVSESGRFRARSPLCGRDLSIPAHTDVHESSVKTERRDSAVRKDSAVVICRDIFRWVDVRNVVHAKCRCHLPGQWQRH